MFYKALGFAVWKAVRFYLGQKLPRNRVLAGVGLAVVATATAIALGAKRTTDE